ncbi:hypothetical protein [Flavobacterium davisii]|uniref:Uncharacterized protein n=1 Tax=Flavobacterium columnare TaxID=996 RepID=A0A8G0KW59_9FLAO|nr:hypothetical protein [Flavobacterium davisii]QYS88340.1 hypothetical protein JJC05_11450 [Flavobacterium davisii]
MKKILQILVLGTTLLVNAQTPIYHFNFDNTLSDINNTVRFVPNPRSCKYSKSYLSKWL